MLQYCKRIQLERAEKKYVNFAVKIEGIINFTKENKRVHAVTISLSLMKFITYSLYFSTKKNFGGVFFFSTAATPVRIQFQFCLNIREIYIWRNLYSITIQNHAWKNIESSKVSL